MGKVAKTVIGVGLIAILITLVIFFVPNFGEAKTEIEYAKLGVILFSELVVIFGLIFLSKDKSIFLNAGLTSSMVIYFILNMIGIFLVSKIELLIAVAATLFLILLAIFIVMLKVNSNLKEESEKKLEDLDIPKSGSSF